MAVRIARTDRIGAMSLAELERQWRRRILMRPNWFGGSPDWMRVEDAAHRLLRRKWLPVEAMIYANGVASRAFREQMSTLMRYDAACDKPVDPYRRERRLARRVVQTSRRCGVPAIMAGGDVPPKAAKASEMKATL